MKPRLPVLSAIAVVAVAVICFLWFRPGSGKEGGFYNNSEEAGGGGDAASPGAGGGTSPDTRSHASGGRLKNEDSAERLLGRALDVLRRGDAKEIEAILAELDGFLKSSEGNSDATIAAIVAFLRSGADASTGMGFVVGEGGVLSEATSLRVYLMDKLGVLCREAGRDEALLVARQTLEKFGSADEWAVSMRNVAWADPSGDDFLREKATAMLDHEPWRDQPTAGMLEAFDVLVHAKALSSIADLGEMLVMRDSPLSRASAVALERLASGDSGSFVSALNQDPALLSGVPLERADLVSRADLSDAAQREQVDTYLLRTDVSAEERNKFFQSLIQSGHFLSNNLITPATRVETQQDTEARMGTLAKTVNAWMRDPRFIGFQADLAELGATVNAIVDEMEADEGSR